MDEKVDPAKLGGCARLSLTWGLGCPVGVGWVGPDLAVGPAGLLVSALGKYLDPVKKGIYVALRTRHMGVLKFPGTVLVACRRKVTSDLATCGPVQDALAQGIFD